MFILEIDATKITGTENNKSVSCEVKNPDSILLKALSQAPDINPIDPPPPPSPGMLLGKIMDLSNEYIIYALEHQMIRKDDKAMVSAPWEKSNELYEALAQYTGTPSTKEKIADVKSLFYKVMKNRPADQNDDGKLDFNDVLTLWYRGSDNVPDVVKKGDINFDGKIDQADVREFANDLLVGDMNKDGKLDKEDYYKLKEIAIRPHLDRENSIIRPGFILGDLNHDQRVDFKDLDLLGKILRAGDMDNDGKIDRKDLKILIDLVRDKPKLPPRVHIDLNNDKKNDYFILNGRIFDRNGKEIDSIEGIDLYELSKEIQEHGGLGAPERFQTDINHDGKMDKIFTDNMPVVWHKNKS